MPKISIFIPDLCGGGAERMMVHLVNEIAGRGVDCELILARRTGPYLSLVGENVVIAGLDVSFMNPLVIYRLARHLARSRPDALLSAMTYPNVAALLARRIAGTPEHVVISERVVLTVQSQQSGGLKERLKPMAARMTYRMADHITAVSDDVAGDLAAEIGIPSEDITIINNPVIAGEGIAQRDPPAHPWFRDHDRPLILAVGRLAPQKDYPTLLAAFARVLENRRARLLILGEGPERAVLQDFSRELGVVEHVEMPGYAEDPYAFMQHADLLVLSSAWEGSPNVLVEAMACGCPIVSTDCPGGPRQILEDGRYGRLVHVGATDDLAAAILETLDKPTSSDQLRARASAYTARESASHYLDVLLPGWHGSGP